MVVSSIFNRLRLKMNGATIGKHIISCGTIYLRNYANRGKLRIGNDVIINSGLQANPVGKLKKTSLIVGHNGRIVLGDRVRISNATLFSQVSISIGDDTFIGGGSQVFDTDFHSIYSKDRVNGNINVATAPVEIGQRVFIGADSIILKGVRIGDDSVIGAGSVITKSISNGEVWAGNPARLIKKMEIDENCSD